MEGLLVGHELTLEDPALCQLIFTQWLGLLVYSHWANVKGLFRHWLRLRLCNVVQWDWHRCLNYCFGSKCSPHRPLYFSTTAEVTVFGCIYVVYIKHVVKI